MEEYESSTGIQGTHKIEGPGERNYPNQQQNLKKKKKKPKKRHLFTKSDEVIISSQSGDNKSEKEIAPDKQSQKTEKGNQIDIVA